MYAIAIDGPAGAGKSTISREAAKRIGFLYVDTGALYRAVGYDMLKSRIDPADEKAVCTRLPQIEVAFGYEDGEQQIYLNKENITANIRTPQVSAAASAVSAIGQVRQFLFGQQQNIARENNIIMDGRDIGTVVLPDAQVKIYLTAAVEERARRRFAELQEKGIGSGFDEVLADVKKRDENDTKRKVAPLRQAPDAILVDTTALDFEQSVQAVLAVIKEKIGQEII
ncbi:MAG: (d)CMP kinase [Oscillospiraceae bacterium]|nr:(d)CMP kinase [Oscillospiraceae bacterium]